jgi:hypothetical protein
MRRLLLMSALVVAMIATAAAQSPTVETIEIGSVEPGARSWVVAINRHSVVVGTSENRNFSPFRYRIFTWTRLGGFRIVLENAKATDVNDRGVIIGARRLCAYDERCQERGFSWSPSAGAVDLGAFVPFAINNAGTMVGFVNDVTQPSIRLGGQIRRLPDGFIPIDINDRGVVAGEDRINWQQPSRHAAVWATSFGLRRLDPSGREGSVTSINGSGMVTGASWHIDSAGAHHFNGALFTPLGPAVLTSPASSNAEAISDRGWVVGSAGLKAALWLVGRRLIELPTPGAPLGGTAVDVNDAGHIIGRSNGSAAERRAYFWIVR